MVDHSGMKLGKKAAKHDHRIPLFAHYLAVDLPPVKPVDWIGDQTDFGMMCNDKLGCCTIAAKGHGLQVVTKNVRGEFTVADSQIEHYYSAIDDWNPADPSTDQGGVITDVLSWILKNNFAGRHLGAYCSVNPQSDVDIDLAVQLFGDLDVGVALPISAQNQDVWDVTGDGKTGNDEPGSWGGHDISIHKVDANGDLTCITWGQPKKMTRRWFKTYCDEAYALLWGAWINNGGLSPGGYNYAALLADMTALRAS